MIERFRQPILLNGMHRKRSRSFQPQGILCSLVELQKRIAITGRAVAQVRPLSQGTGVPGQFPTFFQQLIKSVIDPPRQFAQGGDHPRRSMTILDKIRSLDAVGFVEYRHPIGLRFSRRRRVNNGFDHLRADVFIAPGGKELSPCNQRNNIARKAMNGPQILLLLSV